MTITIKPIDTVEACEQFQALERRVWSSEDIDLMPVHVLITVAHNGGVLLGAYANDGPPDLGGLVGAALGWLGAGVDQADARPQLKLCSHMAGVLPEWQGKGVGLQLKLAQRNVMLAQGLTSWMTWTYDPLYRANGVFNIHRLGATCHTYFRNRYGTMTDALNAGAPSDRCQVDWWVQSERVIDVLKSGGTAERVAQDSWHILPSAPSGDFRQPIEQMLPLDGAPLAVPIPDDIAAIRRVDSELGLAWRFYLRDVLESAFSVGYSMMDCLHLPGLGWHYILTEQS